MAIVVPAVGAESLLDALLEELEPWVHLYVSDTPLDADTTLADLVEASWPGYAPKAATGWTPAGWDTDRAVSAADPLLWIYGVSISSNEVYGYYVTNTKDGDFLWVEARPEGPVTLSIPSDSVEVWPRLTLRQDPEPD